MTSDELRNMIEEADVKRNGVVLLSDFMEILKTQH